MKCRCCVDVYQKWSMYGFLIVGKRRILSIVASEGYMVSVVPNYERFRLMGEDLTMDQFKWRFYFVDGSLVTACGEF